VSSVPFATFKRHRLGAPRVELQFVFLTLSGLKISELSNVRSCFGTLQIVRRVDNQNLVKRLLGFQRFETKFLDQLQHFLCVVDVE